MKPFGKSFVMFFVVIAVMVCANVSIAQTEWQKYSGNPILDVGPIGSWDDQAISPGTVIFDGAIYKMWYTGGVTGKSKTGYATSNDGIHWTKYSGNPVLDLGTLGAWDSVYANCPAVIFENNQYKMWYTGYGGGNSWMAIGLATSPDGIHWTKYPNNPVLDRGSWWEGYNVWDPTVIRVGSEYKMWYGGDDGNVARIGYATSVDGINWVKSPSNPVISLTMPWESKGAYSPDVIRVGNEYKMWYQAYNYSNVRIGYATSMDGINWTKYNNPVLDIGSSGQWDDHYVQSPAVIFDATGYKMWYGGNSYSDERSKIGYATTTTTILSPVELAIKVIGAPYLGDGNTWGGKGIVTSNCTGEQPRFVSPDEINNGYNFYDARISNCNWDKGLDCSGLIYWAYNFSKFGDKKLTHDEYNYNLPIYWEYMGATDQYHYNTEAISKLDLIPGDLLFYNKDGFKGRDNLNIRMTHVMMYTGPFTYKGSEYNVIHAFGDTMTIMPANYDFTTEIVTTSGQIKPIKVADYGRVCKPKPRTNGSAKGSGWIIRDSKNTFMLDVTCNNSVIAPASYLKYLDGKTRMSLQSTVINSFSIATGTCTFGGSYTVKGVTYTFTATVTDSSPDTFSISISNGYSCSGPLAGGDIAITLGSGAIASPMQIQIPEKTALLPNYPNPFNPETWIPFKLSEDSDVTIDIYDMTGRLVRNLQLGYIPAGYYVTRDKAVYWDGRSEVGEKVTSGIYFYTITAGNIRAVKKMVIVR